MPPTRTRSASPQRVRARRVGDASSRAPAKAPQAASSDMRHLFALEAQRMQATRLRERAAQEQRRERTRTLDEQLEEERRIAKENRPPGHEWRGYQDYEVELLRAQCEEQVASLQADVLARDEEIKRLRDLLGQYTQQASEQASAQHTWAARVSDLEAQLRTHDARTQQLRTEASDALAHTRGLEARLAEADALRRHLHNQVQELRGNVRVYARVRPAARADPVAEWRYPDAALLATQLEVHVPSESAMGHASVKTHAFAFDHVFPPAATQSDVFAEVSDLLQSVLDGYHTTIFAYGQTGSGKTHTLEGGAGIDWQHAAHALDDDAGLIPRAMHMLWRTAEAQRTHGWSYTFEAQMVEVYLDQVSDLLSDASRRCEIKHTPTHTHVEHAAVEPLAKPEDVYALLARAQKRRQVAATRMNERSSRSHSIFALRVHGECTRPDATATTHATLNLVDLAGSERLAASGSANDAQRLKEAQSINKSLSSLADVISALAAQAKHVPYRNSTLTWLLKPSLSRGAKTYVLFTYNPLQAYAACTLTSPSAPERNFVFPALCCTSTWHTSRATSTSPPAFLGRRRRLLRGRLGLQGRNLFLSLPHIFLCLVRLVRHKVLTLQLDVVHEARNVSLVHGRRDTQAQQG